MFTYKAADTNGDGRMDSYTNVAEPASGAQPAGRGFFTEQSGVIRTNPNGTADNGVPETAHPNRICWRKWALEELVISTNPK